MATRSLEERIAELQQKQKQLKAQEKQLKARASKEERKQRTHRLIEYGAIAEKVLDCKEMSPEEFEKNLIALIDLKDKYVKLKAENEKLQKQITRPIQKNVQKNKIEQNSK